ncbi:restriction endonuclease [Herbiconiux flava]|uniref:Restriction system protein n=1 Tax=Herbiconiux flava TaxID=881268 RepID=A0A852SQC5_9MICO|nr:restriction endonuclease [Herbiconiux flava]NYD71003.1 restriction system protein [Herbiconiux flava]GLK19033.1 restriction endonuclease [Herbiconiux flava]
MPATWGIHNDTSLDLIAGGFVSIGWNLIPDLRTISLERSDLKALLRESYPEAKEGALPIWAGILHRFAEEISPGDLIIAPRKADRTLAFGEVTSGYYWDASASDHKHRVGVRWIRDAVPRSVFSKDALYEIGSAVTLFRVRNYEDEFRTFVASDSAEAVQQLVTRQSEEPEQAVRRADDTPDADRIENYTRDFVTDRILRGMSHRDFEEFVAELLRAVGYQARTTQYSNDGGVDVIAHRDPFGLEPPVIKVQCKHLTGTIGSPEVNQLTGTLARGELGLFVSLGSYSREAKALERNRQDLRLIDGDEVIDLVLANYEKFANRWRSIIPLRNVYVVDQFE